MAFTRIASGVAHSSDGNTATVTLDTRTANLFVISISRYTPGTPVVMTDGLNDGTFLYKTERISSASSGMRQVYVINPTTNISNVFTGAGAGSFFSFGVDAFLCDAGTPIFDTENGAASGSAITNISTNASTPAVAGSLVVGGLSFFGNNNNPDAGSYVSPLLSSGVTNQQIYTGNGLGVASGWKASESSSINPNWSWLIGGIGGVANCATSMLIFSPPGGGAAGPLGKALRLTQAVQRASSW